MAGIRKKKPLENKKVKPLLRNQRDLKGSIGEVYYVHPSHVVPSKEMKDYKSSKGNLNSRPVAIMKVNASNKAVSISKMTSKKPKASQIEKGQRIRLSNTKMPKETYISNELLSKSMKTGKEFKKNKSPLNKKPATRIHKTDLKKISAIKNKKSHKK